MLKNCLLLLKWPILFVLASIFQISSKNSFLASTSGLIRSSFSATFSFSLYLSSNFFFLFLLAAISLSQFPSGSPNAKFYSTGHSRIIHIYAANGERERKRERKREKEREREGKRERKREKERSVVEQNLIAF